MEVELAQQLLLDGEFRSVGAEEESVGQDDGGASSGLQAVLKRSAVSLEVRSEGKWRFTSFFSLPP